MALFEATSAWDLMSFEDIKKILSHQQVYAHMRRISLVIRFPADIASISLFF